MGLSSKPVFDDWHQTAYAHMLSFLTGYPVERLKPDESDRVMTFISDAEGNPVNIPLRPLKSMFEASNKCAAQGTGAA